MHFILSGIAAFALIAGFNFVWWWVVDEHEWPIRAWREGMLAGNKKQ